MSYRVVIETEPVSNHMGIFLINENRRSMSILRIVGDVYEWVGYEEGTLMPGPTLRLEGELSFALHQALKERFPQPHPPGELEAARLEGELAGAKAHLEATEDLLGRLVGYLNPRTETRVGEVSEEGPARTIHGEAVSAGPVGRDIHGGLVDPIESMEASGSRAERGEREIGLSAERMNAGTVSVEAEDSQGEDRGIVEDSVGGGGDQSPVRRALET